MEIKLVRFKDGLDVISYCNEHSYEVELTSPMMFELRGMNLVLQHWLPVAVMKGDSAKVGLDCIQCMMDPTDDFASYYSETVIRMQEKMEKESEVALTDEVLAAFEDKELGKSLIH
jgi:hypothetical protein